MSISRLDSNPAEKNDHQTDLTAQKQPPKKEETLAKKVPAEKDIEITKTRTGSQKATPNGSQQSIIATSQQVITATNTTKLHPVNQMTANPRSQNYGTVKTCKSASLGLKSLKIRQLN
ncbi:hypothetical protein Pst134EA_032918 [Puccinia striiformis f. sp. tritici]|uniref:uncharacterized protein n=1 Tax=Puccinia striiformis f. sp. tritici TaxID=168172 RepID=UPI00200733FF|nr:uncharacterized protein Pst134EA_032918 [Puccinia striiformis f. sp. tritici]KAH9441526.1 hypothetical protein Pst134EA_032918 [Puccinia striiformis f. sp. tritici]